MGAHSGEVMTLSTLQMLAAISRLQASSCATVAEHDGGKSATHSAWLLAFEAVAPSPQFQVLP
jgi:hypothetical protein